MPYTTFKKYLTNQLSSGPEETYNFQGSFAEVLNQKTTHEESVILMLALVPHILPGYLDDIIKEIFPKGGDIPQLGGVRTNNHRGLLPTGETAQYILAEGDITKRIQIIDFFKKDHWFYLEDILYLETVTEGEPVMSGRIILTAKAISLLVYGQISDDDDNLFPAHKIATSLSWNDLILNEQTKTQIDEILHWEKNKNKILNEWNQSKYFKKGFRVLMHGPSGTGKTLTASLLGNELSKIHQKEVPVYRIDLSMIVSKYIGETEKNLGKLFAKAENKDWILFFDEGENFFSNRTNIRDSNDKHSNQEVSYLLQRIEDFNGLVIVATNLKTNIDDAFARRFQSMIEFKVPDEVERKQLWSNILPDQKFIDREPQLIQELTKYNLSGGNIVNVIQYACLKAVEMEKPLITIENCLVGIKRELAKMGRTI